MTAKSTGDAGDGWSHSREDDVLVVDVFERVGAGEDLVELVVVDVDDDQTVVRHTGEPLQGATQVLNGALLRQRDLVEHRPTRRLRPHHANLAPPAKYTVNTIKCD